MTGAWGPLHFGHSCPRDTNGLHNQFWKSSPGCSGRVWTELCGRTSHTCGQVAGPETASQGALFSGRGCCGQVGVLRSTFLLSVAAGGPEGWWAVPVGVVWLESLVCGLLQGKMGSVLF